MNELACAIARFVRGADKTVTVSVERYGSRGMNSRVNIKGVNSTASIDVEWFKGGARVAGTRFYRDEVSKEFDLEEIFTRVTGRLTERAKAAERAKNEAEQKAIFAPIKDATRLDKRLRVEHCYWNDKTPYRVEFTTGDLTGFSMVLDFLLNFADPGTEFIAKPTPADMSFNVTGHVTRDDVSLFEVAHMEFMTPEAYAKVLALNIGDNVQTIAGTFWRIA